MFLKKSDHIIVISILTYLLIRYFSFFWVLDDTFIMLRIARNISLGNGYVFNVGAPVLAASSIIWPVLISVLFPFARDPFLVIKYSSLFFGVLSLVIIVKIGEKLFCGTKFAYLPALLFILDPGDIFNSVSGMDCEIFLFSILALTYLLCDPNVRNPAHVYFLIAVIPLTRYEGFLFSLLALLFLEYKGHTNQIQSKGYYLLIPVITWISLFVFTFSYFGVVLPTTLQAKLSFFEDALKDYGVFPFIISTYGSALPIVFLSLKRVLKKDILLFIASWAIMLLISHHLFFPMYGLYFGRYMLPAIPFFHMILTQGYITLNEFIQKHFKNNHFFIFLIVFLLTIFQPLYSIKVYYEGVKAYTDVDRDVDLAITNWLSGNTNGTAYVITFHLGRIAYMYGSGKVEDFTGIANPDIIAYVQRNDILSYLVKEKPDYVTDMGGGSFKTKNIYVNEYFNSACSIVFEVPHRYMGTELNRVLYKCNW
ncbi:MAG: hypothetical protein KKD39_04735 [Candidatus Altiarchaeota archaeon]|nr:hypothetical protein [Candidatus Altiarchaeota archaeon]